MNRFERDEAERIVTALEQIAAATRIIVTQAELNFGNLSPNADAERLLAEDRRTLGLPECGRRASG